MRVSAMDDLADDEMSAPASKKDAQLPEPLDDVLEREEAQRRQVAEILRRAR
jgi:hypothetical protein